MRTVLRTERSRQISMCNVVATFATYTRFYHDERWPIQFSIGIQESKNMDEMTCAPVQMSYRLLGIFSEATNEPVCGHYNTRL